MSNLRVYSITSLQKMKSNPHYQKAKSGDFEEAKQLVEDLFVDKNISFLNGNEILVPIVAQEASGRNKIPMAIAMYLSHEYGNDIEMNILQTVRANHTNSEAYKRIFNVKFETVNTCLEGNEYVIVDDHVTMGGTVSSLAKFIREHGGVVSNVISISNNTRQIKEEDGGQSITPKEEEIQACKDRFGDFFETLSGLKYEEMSRPTILQLLRFKNIDNVRTKYKDITSSDDYELTQEEKIDLWQEFNADYLSYLFGK